MDIQISRERRTQNEQARLASILTLAQAKPATDQGQAEAAVALMVMWVVAEDEADFGSLLELAMSVTEEDHTEVTDLARDGEFAAAARWLLG